MDDKQLLYVLRNPHKKLMLDEASPFIKEYAKKTPLKYSSGLINLLNNEKSKSQGEGWTVESVFDESIITKYEPTSYGYDFWLKGLSIPVKVKLTHRINSRFVDFSLSHYIKTPEQMGVYRPSNQFGDYLEYALQRAVSAITDFYQIAVKNGHEPQDSWLQENNLF